MKQSIGPTYTTGLRAALDTRYPEGTTYVEDDAHARTIAILPDGRAESWIVGIDPATGDIGAGLEGGGL